MDHGKCSLQFQNQIQKGEKLLQTTAQLQVLSPLLSPGLWCSTTKKVEVIGEQQTKHFYFIKQLAGFFWQEEIWMELNFLAGAHPTKHCDSWWLSHRMKGEQGSKSGFTGWRAWGFSLLCQEFMHTLPPPNTRNYCDDHCPSPSPDKNAAFLLLHCRKEPSFTTIFTMQDTGAERRHNCHVSTNLPGISDGTEWKAFCLAKQ